MASNDKKMHIVSLGSSFAAGPGLAPYEDAIAMRSLSNYAHRLATQLGAQLTDLTVSGATLLNIISTTQDVNGKMFAPQMNTFPTDANVVMILGGGNDLGYIGGMIQDEMKRSNPRLLETLNLTSSDTPDLQAKAVSDRLITIIDRVSELAAEAIIILVEYLPVLGHDTKSGRDVAMSDEEIARHKQVAERLRSAYRLASSARPKVHLITTTEVAADHALGSATPWVNGFTDALFEKGGVFHPNQAGMDAIARRIAQFLAKH